MSEPRDIVWLRESLAALDRIYFSDALSTMGVGIKWMPWRKLKRSVFYGYYDAPTIYVNRALAWPWVPDYVVIATIFHEALHAVQGDEHDHAFLLAEQRYVHHSLAQVWETENHAALLNADNPHRRVRA